MIVTSPSSSPTASSLPPQIDCNPKCLVKQCMPAVCSPKLVLEFSSFKRGFGDCTYRPHDNDYDQASQLEVLHNLPFYCEAHCFFFGLEVRPYPRIAKLVQIPPRRSRALSYLSGIQRCAYLHPNLSPNQLHLMLLHFYYCCFAAISQILSRTFQHRHQTDRTWPPWQDAAVALSTEGRNANQ